ncbi:MAG: ABC transporter substrate-binding protein [Casimicrobiaceae bacterium]
MTMRRRDLLSLPLGMFPTWLAAQSAKVYRIGWLSAGPPIDALWKVFIDGLRDRGWIEGKNVAFDFRASEGRDERFPTLRAELVQRRVDLIVTGGTPPTVAAAKVTTTIPIVFWSVGDPVGLGLVESLARPGRNLTGTGALGPAHAKMLELLKEVFPKATRIAMFFNDAFPLLVSQRPQIDAMARRLGVELTAIQVRGPEDIERAFGTVAHGKFDALFIVGQPFLAAERVRLAKLALETRIPAISPFNVATEAGLLMSYGSRFVDDMRRLPDYIDRIFKGAKPGDLPVEQPTTFHFVINLRTAKAIGVVVPPAMVARADQLIQ